MTKRFNDCFMQLCTPDDGPVRPKTRRSLLILKWCCDFSKACAFCWFTLQQFYHNTRKGKCKIGRILERYKM